VVGETETLAKVCGLHMSAKTAREEINCSGAVRGAGRRAVRKPSMHPVSPLVVPLSSEIVGSYS
jgi:hypothetical protein